MLPQAAKEIERVLARVSYIADEKTVLLSWLAMELGRPLLLEGPAGVGKTDLARALSEGLERPLFRLQCYEGLDEAKALYEWDYAKQMLYTQLLRESVAKETASAASISDAMDRLSSAGEAFFSRRFLVERPILQAMLSPKPAILLIDEVDRSDPEFEAFLLEVLAEGQVSIPELGTIRAVHPPLVLLTSNGTRDLTDALLRRCLHEFLDYPPPSREQAILELRVPGLSSSLAASLTAMVNQIRAMDLEKAPSISETIDWARTLVLLGASALDRATVESTLGVLLKYEADRQKVEAKLPMVTG